jgi:hypothetical protein
MPSIDDELSLNTVPEEQVRGSNRIHRDDWCCELYSSADAGLEMFLLEDLSQSGAFLVSMEPEIEIKDMGHVIYGFLVAPDGQWRLPFTARIARKVTMDSARELQVMPGFAIEFVRIDREALLGVCPIERR